MTTVNNPNSPNWIGLKGHGDAFTGAVSKGPAMSAHTGNRILRTGLAIVDGRTTGLAGCARSEDCRISWQCLRASPSLTYRAADRADPNGHCPIFILAGASRHSEVDTIARATDTE